MVCHDQACRLAKHYPYSTIFAAQRIPAGVVIDYAGQSRQFKSEGQQLLVTFFFALVIIFLVLAAQFESFRDSIIVLVTVPMSICGALIFVSLGFAILKYLYASRARNLNRFNCEAWHSYCGICQ